MIRSSKMWQAIALTAVAGLALSACGPDDIASPGSGGNITINNPPAPA